MQISNDAEACEFLQELVAIPSLSGNEAAAAECFVREMTMYGSEANIDAAGNAVARFGTGQRQLVLLGHIDTVPGEVPVRREGSRLYGRGAVDAKGPLAAMAMAAARCGAREGWYVVVAGAPEEEAATSRGARYLATQLAPEYCIIGEPSGWNRITLGYKGRLLLHYRLEQPSGHSAGQQTNAVEEAVRFWNHLQSWCEGYNAGTEGRFAAIDPALQRINSDSDGLCDSVTIQISLRLPPEAPLEALRSQIDSWRGDACIDESGKEEAVVEEKRSPLTAAFLGAIRSEGARPAFVFKTGTSDMNVVAPVWRCPIVAYGPGDSALDHTPDEHIDLDEYLASIRVLQAVIERLTTAI